MMKHFFVSVIVCFSTASVVAQTPRESLPVAVPNTSIFRFPTEMVAQETEKSAPDYEQLIANADYLFREKRYTEAIDRYEKALPYADDRYAHDQLIRARALQAKEEKELESERIRRMQFIPHILTYNNWQQMAVVCDVTGSMNGSTDQLIAWMKTRLQEGDTNIRRVVLFNDNDNMSRGNTDPLTASGLYSFVPVNEQQMRGEVAKAKKESTGGDVRENNITALLKAQLDCPECASLVMIHDNNEPWDITEMSKVTKPVHMLVCGPVEVLKPCFLDLARATNGSVHFNGLSYHDLINYKEGDVLKINQTSYLLQQGKFRQMY